jgi:hypothetical protein
MKKLLSLGVAGVLFLGASLAQAQTVTVDNNAAQNLFVDPNQSAVSIDPATGNAFVRTQGQPPGTAVVTFTAPSGGTISVAPGATVSISWTVSNVAATANPCVPTGQWAGLGALPGSATSLSTQLVTAPNANGTYTYSLACRNTASVLGNVASVTVVVGNDPCIGITPPPNLQRQAFPQTWEEWSTCITSTSCNGPVQHYPFILNYAVIASSPGNYVSIAFRTGSNPGGLATNNPPNYGTFDFVSEGGTAGVWRVTVSKCQGDFRLSTDAVANPPIASCIADNAGEPKLTYALTAFGAVGCNIIEPDTTYYLNLTLGNVGGGPGFLNCTVGVCKLRGLHRQNSFR